MTKKVSVKGAARRAISADKKVRKDLGLKDEKAAVTMDSFVNFAHKMGVGADNATSGGGYGFNPITRVRTTLEWVHRGSWLGGVAIDLVADDMTRGGIELVGDLKPEDNAKIEERIVTLGIWNSLNETIQWARLYGGSIAVMLVDGQDYKTPLRLETVGKDQFKGMLVLDRWMVEPSLNDLIQEPGPNLGLPKYYNIIADSPALPNLRIHHTRCIRLEGIKLPYWQRLQENLWGISVIERLYDRMLAFDSATTGAAQLVYKAFIRTYKVQGLREIIGSGGQPLAGLMAYVEMIRRFQGVEGMTLMDKDDEFEATVHQAFGGLSDALMQFGQQLAGALQIPLVRLFGQSPAGLNSTGESDLRMYYDGIKQQQEKTLRVGVTRIYRMAAQSVGVQLPPGIRLEFRSLWQLQDKEKSEIAESTTRSVMQARDGGLISDKVALEELRQSARVTGIYSNISDEDILSASDIPAPPAGAVLGEEESEPAAGGAEGATPPEKKEQAQEFRDASPVAAFKRLHDLDIVIENPKGSVRQGGEGEKAWKVHMPDDYGYIRRTNGADGDQVDCYLGPNPSSNRVFVINQVDPDTGVFDEHKIMVGYQTPVSAQQIYLEGYTDGRGSDRMGSMKVVSMTELKDWLAHGDTTKPFV